ncbi:MAG: molybdenum cofactor guanylyltransferase [Actinomycetota bacterium]|nr:molybdenum cofactor guanylyltransferase [Actinomycetota bacterium]
MRGDARLPLPPFTGAVLTGGASRRMGRDKALVDVDGRALAAIVADALHGAGADGPVLAIGGDRPALARLGLETVADDHPGEGPLAGIITALACARHEVVVILACDLPGVDAGTVRLVVRALVGDGDAGVAAAVDEGGRLRPLHAAWRRSVLPQLQTAVDRGERAVHRVLADLVVVPVDGVGPWALVDVDTPADLDSCSWSKGAAVRQTGES